MEDGWDVFEKHILILSCSGKPIFSKHGDEQELVTNFGLLQAVFSIVHGSGDTLRSISAGKRKILYIVRDTLYFVIISSTGEPDAVLCKQLEFAYSQILLILTSQVHRVLENNSSKDLRYLLGSDSTKLMKTITSTDIATKTVLLDSLQALPMHSIVRYKILSQMRSCMENSNAAACLLLCGEKLIMHLTNPSSELSFGSPDFTLLSTLVSSSSSLRSHEQNWVPICLPYFSADAYLQAYVAHFLLSETRGSKNSISLVLVSNTSDPESFRVLHSARTFFEEEISKSCTAAEIKRSIDEEKYRLSKYRYSFLAMHYFFKWSSTQDKDSSVRLVPAQYVSSDWDSTCTDEEKSIAYAVYYQNAVRLRSGTSISEHSLGKNDGDQTMNEATCSSIVERYTKRWRQYDASIPLNVPIKSLSRYAYSIRKELSTHSNRNCLHLPNVLQLLPLSNHSLVYTCTSNHTVIGLASCDSELHVCLPSMIEPLHACSLANGLFHSLKADSDDLFQTVNHC